MPPRPRCHSSAGARISCVVSARGGALPPRPSGDSRAWFAGRGPGRHSGSGAHTVEAWITAPDSTRPSPRYAAP